MEFQYCLFYKNDRLQFGWIREVRKNKPVIVPVQGKEFSSSTNRLEYIWSGKIIQNEKDALAHLAEKSEETVSMANDIELDVIHELCDTGVPYTLEELAENFLDDPEDGWLRVALLIKIKQERKRFQQKKNQFVARSVADIQKLEEEEERKQEQKRRLTKEATWAEDLREDKLPVISPEEKEHWNQFLQRVWNYLRYLESSQEKEYVKTLFHCQNQEQIVTERRLLHILSLAGFETSWGYLILSRVEAQATVSDDELSAISTLKERDVRGSRFNLETEDDTALLTYTVDNADTRDYDDAVSLEELDEGFLLRVHIADVASFIEPGSPLFHKGESRMSSLYTIKETYPMFHPDLSENVFSLKESVDRPVLTFEIQVNGEGERVNSRIYRSIINVNRNLTYEAVDQAIAENDPYWTAVFKICLGLKQTRIDNGSLELERTEIKMDISDPDAIQIKEIRENTPASLSIEELAIFANHQAASFCNQHELLCLYRNQPPYSVNRQIEEGEKLTLRDIHIQPARIGTIPEGHSALGLDCYMQVTSPIRRFLDLINQGVIFAQMATQESSYSSDDLLNWARLGEEVQREYTQVERLLSDHWKIKYLEQNRDEVYEAQFFRSLRGGKLLINILKVQLIVECVADEALPESFQVILDQVKPEYNRVIARPCAASSSTSTAESEGAESEIDPESS